MEERAVKILGILYLRVFIILLSYTFVILRAQFIDPLCKMTLVGQLCDKIRGNASSLAAESRPTMDWDELHGILNNHTNVLEQALSLALTSQSADFMTDLKRAQLATDDLIVLVNRSDLDERERIVEVLLDFSSHNGRAARALSLVDMRVEQAFQR